MGRWSASSLSTEHHVMWQAHHVQCGANSQDPGGAGHTPLAAIGLWCTHSFRHLPHPIQALKPHLLIILFLLRLVPPAATPVVKFLVQQGCIWLLLNRLAQHVRVGLQARERWTAQSGGCMTGHALAARRLGRATASASPAPATCRLFPAALPVKCSHAPEGTWARAE